MDYTIKANNKNANTDWRVQAFAVKRIHPSKTCIQFIFGELRSNGKSFGSAWYLFRMCNVHTVYLSSLLRTFPPLILPVLLAAIRPIFLPALAPLQTVEALPICWWLPPPWGCSTGFIATPRTCKQTNVLLLTALGDKLFLFKGWNTQSQMTNDDRVWRPWIL